MMYWNINEASSSSSSLPGGATNLNDLSDVVISTPQANQVLKYDGATFINSEVPGLADIQAQFSNLNANNITSGTIDYARLPNLNIGEGTTPPYISSITPITTSGNQDIDIIGSGFLPSTNLSIPGVTVNTLSTKSPNKITANISKSGLTGNPQITLSNGDKTNQLWPDSIKFLNIILDPFWANVLLFIKGQGSSIIEEKSGSAVAIFGNTSISTSQSKYGGASIYFDGSGDYLQLSNMTLTLAGDFTVEGWVYLVNSNPVFLSSGSSSGNQEFFIYSTGVWLGRTNVAWDLQLSLATNLNTWNHFAFCRSGNTLRIFRNGVQVHTMTYTTAINLSAVLIGRDFTGTRQSAGFLSHLRLTNIARYTTAFNPETGTYLN